MFDTFRLINAQRIGCPEVLFDHGQPSHIATGAGRCHPLTVRDDQCRYSLGLIACGNETGVTVRTELTNIFRRYGLPRAMLSDNGSPWCDHGTGEYIALEVWLRRLGVRL